MRFFLALCWVGLIPRIARGPTCQTFSPPPDKEMDPLGGNSSSSLRWYTVLTRWSRMVSRLDTHTTVWKSWTVNWRAVFFPFFSLSFYLSIFSSFSGVLFFSCPGGRWKLFQGSGRPRVCHLATWNVPASTPPGFFAAYRTLFKSGRKDIFELKKQERTREAFLSFLFDDETELSQ